MSPVNPSYNSSLIASTSWVYPQAQNYHTALLALMFMTSASTSPLILLVLTLKLT